jgi:hypothetical protein
LFDFLFQFLQKLLVLLELDVDSQLTACSNLDPVDVFAVHTQWKFDRFDLDDVRRLHFIQDLDLDHIFRGEKALRNRLLDQFDELSLPDARFKGLLICTDNLHG